MLAGFNSSSSSSSSVLLRPHDVCRQAVMFASVLYSGHRGQFLTSRIWHAVVSKRSKISITWNIHLERRWLNFIFIHTIPLILQGSSCAKFGLILASNVPDWELTQTWSIDDGWISSQNLVYFGPSSLPSCYTWPACRYLLCCPAWQLVDRVQASAFVICVIKNYFTLLFLRKRDDYNTNNNTLTSKAP